MASKAAKVKIKPNLTGNAETLLAILIARAIDAKSSRPVLGDRHAAAIVDRLDYDFSKLRIWPVKAIFFAIRSRLFDCWVATFLATAQQRNEPVTVLHLAAGLDTRALRLDDSLRATSDASLGADTSKLVHWIDSDLPNVVAVRKQLAIPEPTAMHYELKDADVTEKNWLGHLGLPRNRRAIVIAEGLTMYLAPAEGRALFETLTGYFVAEGNQIAFDCVHQMLLWFAKVEPMLKNTNAAFRWAINDPKDLEDCHRGLRLCENISAIQNPANAALPLYIRWAFWLASWIPGARSPMRFVRFEW